MSTEQGFLAALAANLEDWDLRLVFADWLEEHDRPIEANGQRWQAVYHKRPYGAFYESVGSNLFFWYDASSCQLGDYQSNLPGDVFRALAYHRPQRHQKYFPTFHSAEMMLASSLHALDYTF